MELLLVSIRIAGWPPASGTGEVGTATVGEVRVESCGDGEGRDAKSLAAGGHLDRLQVPLLDRLT